MPHIDPNIPPVIIPEGERFPFPLPTDRGPLPGPIGTPVDTAPPRPGSDAERIAIQVAQFICSFGAEPLSGPSCADVAGIVTGPIVGSEGPVDVSVALPPSATPPFVPSPDPDVAGPIARTVSVLLGNIGRIFQRGPLVNPPIETTSEGAGVVFPRTFPRLAVRDHASAAA